MSIGSALTVFQEVVFSKMLAMACRKEIRASVFGVNHFIFSVLMPFGSMIFGALYYLAPRLSLIMTSLTIVLSSIVVSYSLQYYVPHLLSGRNTGQGSLQN